MLLRLARPALPRPQLLGQREARRRSVTRLREHVPPRRRVHDQVVLARARPAAGRVAGRGADAGGVAEAHGGAGDVAREGLRAKAAVDRPGSRRALVRRAVHGEHRPGPLAGPVEERGGAPALCEGEAGGARPARVGVAPVAVLPRRRVLARAAQVAEWEASGAWGPGQEGRGRRRTDAVGGAGLVPTEHEGVGMCSGGGLMQGPMPVPQELGGARRGADADRGRVGQVGERRTLEP